jgi:hypothetical protein
VPENVLLGDVAGEDRGPGGYPARNVDGPALAPVTSLGEIEPDRQNRVQIQKVEHDSGERRRDDHERQSKTIIRAGDDVSRLGPRIQVADRDQETWPHQGYGTTQRRLVEGT